MITKSEHATTEKSANTVPLAPFDGEKQTISPGERWLLITEKAYNRVQRRGFVGGDPFEDWSEAEREVDAKYETEFPCVLAQTDAEMLTEQLKRVFGGYGLGHLSLDAILERHREGLERMAEHHRKLFDSTSKLATQQTALFQDAVSDAMDTLQSFAQGNVSKDGFARQAEMSAQAIENVLSYFKTLTEIATNRSPPPKKGGGDK